MADISKIQWDCHYSNGYGVRGAFVICANLDNYRAGAIVTDVEILSSRIPFGFFKACQIQEQLIRGLNMSNYCRQPDRDTEDIRKFRPSYNAECGHPLPCPWHTLEVSEIGRLFVPPDADVSWQQTKLIQEAVDILQEDEEPVDE